MKKNLVIITKKIHTNKQYSSLLKRYCTYIARVFFSTIHHNQITQEWLIKNVTEKGFDELIKAHKNGEKIIMTSAHFGNWEIARDYFTKVHDLPLTVMYREQNNLKLSKLFYGHHRKNTNDNEITRKGKNSAHYRGNIKMIEKRSKTALKQMLQSITEGRIIVVLLDQKDIHSTTPIEFFDQEAFLPTAISRIAIKNGCKIFACHCTAQNFTLHCDAILDAKSFQNEVDLTREIFKTFEKWIAANPTNWYCLTHDLWKR